MIEDYLEFDKETKNLKSLNLDDFSLSELKNYIEQLKNEINRVNTEVEKKINLQKEAEKLFK